MLFSMAVVVAALIGSIPAVIQQYHTDRPGFRKTLRLLAVYFLYVLTGVVLLLLLLRGEQPMTTSITATLFEIAWILYGSLWLTRGVPRHRELPAWIDRHPSGIDYGFWLVIAGTLATAVAGHYM
jgi:hypothetical protein